jgi:hypothetical protein
MADAFGKRLLPAGCDGAEIGSALPTLLKGVHQLIMSILPSLILTLPIILVIIFLANWFALWFKPLLMVLLGIQLTITGIFMLGLWLVLNSDSDVHQYGALAYFAVVFSLLGLLLSCSFAWRRH